ncbi:MAG: AraC family transcriptional regulator [bacterium]
MTDASTLSLRAEALTGYKALVSEKGGNPDELLKAANISPSAFDHPDNRIGVQEVIALQKITCRALNDPLFYFHLAKSQQGLSMGALGRLAMSCSTLREALTASFRYLPAQTEAATWALQEKDGLAYMTRQGVLAQSDFNQSVRLYNCTKAVSGFRFWLGDDWNPRAVLFDLNIVGDLEELESYYRAPIKFDQPLPGIVFDAKDLDKKLQGANPERKKTLERRIQLVMKNFGLNRDLSARVQLLIEESLSSGHFRLERIAELLSLHPKALARKLSEEGKTYNDILRTTQLEKAKYYLKNTSIGLTDISILLGYSEPSAFSRAFKSQTGTSPKAWRAGV